MKQIRHVTSFENSVRNAGPLEVCVTKDTYVKKHHRLIHVSVSKTMCKVVIYTELENTVPHIPWGHLLSMANMKCKAVRYTAPQNMEPDPHLLI